MTLHEAALTVDQPRASLAAGSDVMRLGFMPLIDCAPLIVADELGLFTRHGVTVSLTPLNAWVALRDRIAIGKLDGGQMLCPMPIAAGLGLGGVASALAVVSVLASQGNAITLSEALIAELDLPQGATADPSNIAASLARAVRARAAAGRPKLVLAVVYAYSSHNYLLRHFLAAAGIDPEHDVILRAVPPPQIADELAEGRIDGFCAGQPWGSRAVDLRCGRIALATADIWPNHPEKLLAISSATLARDPDRVTAVVAATIEAGHFLADPANHAQVALWLHERALPQVPLAVVRAALSTTLRRAPDEAPALFASPNFDPALSCPSPTHGAWWLRQMRRWGHAPQGTDDIIGQIWRPDIWQRAARLAPPANRLSPSIPTQLPCPGDLA